MLLPISITVGAVIFATLILMTLFKYITPNIVMADYKPCAGGWHEGHLNQCSSGLIKIPQQPINTYSNLAYLAIGVFIALYLQTPPAIVFGFTMIYLFIGSTLYHALSTRWAGMLDVTSMYSVFSALLMYALGVLLNLPVWIIIGLMFIVAGLAAYVLSQRFRNNLHLIIGIFLGGTVALVLVKMALTGNWGAWPYLINAIAIYAIAFIIWKLDQAFSFPLKGWGHGFWHVLAGIATGLVFFAIHLMP